MRTMAELKHLDFKILEHLNNQPGHRQVRRNLAHVLQSAMDPDKKEDDDTIDINKVAQKIDYRLQHTLLEREFIQRVGPSDSSGLYELTQKGVDAAEMARYTDYDDPRKRLELRYDIDQMLGEGTEVIA